MSFLVLNFFIVLVIMQHMSTLPIAMSADGLGPATFGWVIAINGLMIVAGQLFVPKLIGVGLALLISGNWMLHTLIAFTQDLFERIPSMLG